MRAFYFVKWMNQSKKTKIGELKFLLDRGRNRTRQRKAKRTYLSKLLYTTCEIKAIIYSHIL